MKKTAFALALSIGLVGPMAAFAQTATPAAPAAPAKPQITAPAAPTHAQAKPALKVDCTKAENKAKTECKAGGKKS